jgi:CDP-diacylglycerol--glycerol-3-phosphate 3-phosphatidyltransferase
MRTQPRCAFGTASNPTLGAKEKSRLLVGFFLFVEYLGKICYIIIINHMQIKDLNLPNILSLSRIVLAFTFAILLFKDYKFAAAAVFFAAVLTDVADGYLARKFKQVTTLGKILDPAADRLLMLLAFLILYLNHGLPGGLAMLAIGYHLFIIFGWVMVFQTKNIAIPHTFWGKLNSFLQAAMFFAVIFGFYPQIFFAIVTCSILVALLSYLVKGLQIWKEQKSP